jgi:drug/metabolite transporter (DMT)-like permease
MEVTQDVILDLLPVYFSGEASASTRALVDDFLSHDPTFAERVRREWAEPLAVGGAASRAVPDVELRSLNRTRRVLTMQRWLFALALAFTMLPMSMVFSFGGGHPLEFHFLVRDYPAVLLPVLGAGAVCWFLYARLRRRLRVGTQR